MRDEVGKYIAQGIGVGFTEEIPEIGRNAAAAFEQIKLSAPELEIPEFNIPKPELPELVLSVPDIPDITVHADMPELETVDDILPHKPTIDSSAFSALSARSVDLSSSFAAPAAASEVVNSSITYNNIPESRTAADSSQEIVINARFVVGEEVVAEGVKTIIADEIDRQQGIDIQLKQRGLTT